MTDDAHNLKIRVEGSPELLAIVRERLGEWVGVDLEVGAKAETAPRAFLCYAFEDRELASRIAHTLQANGIDTWWDKWCVGAGDSLRQKMDEGLSGCTHFVVLLTPVALQKPWVNQEIDAGLVRKIRAQCKFIPLRHNLPASTLPPLLSGMLSPEISDPYAVSCAAGLERGQS